MDLKKYLRAVPVYFVYILLVSLLQFYWPAGYAFRGLGPDLQLIMTVTCGYLFGFKDGVAVGLCLGFVRDCLSARYFGLGTLLLFCAGALASVLMNKRWSRNLVTIFALILIMTIGLELFNLVFQIAIARNADYGFWPGGWKLILLRRILPGALLNVIFTIPTFICLRYLGPYSRSTGWQDWSNYRREGVYLD